MKAICNKHHHYNVYCCECHNDELAQLQSRLESAEGLIKRMQDKIADYSVKLDEAGAKLKDVRQVFWNISAFCKNPDAAEGCRMILKEIENWRRHGQE